MKAHIILFSLTLFLTLNVIAQNGYQGYRIVFKSGLSTLPQQANDSQMFLLGTKGKMGLFNVNGGLVIPMVYDTIFQPLNFIQRHYDYDINYSYYKVTKGRYFGLYKHNLITKQILNADFDSITHVITKNGPVFITYKDKVKQFYDPLAEGWLKSIKDFENSLVDFDYDLSEVAGKWEYNIEPGQKQYKHDWTNKANVYQMTAYNNNYMIFYSNKLYGVVRKSDSLEIIQAMFTSINVMRSDQMRFECMKGKKYYIYDTLGKLVVPMFEPVKTFINNKRSYNIIPAGDKYGLYSLSEALLIAPKYSSYRLSPDDNTLMFELNGITTYFDFKTGKLENRSYKNLNSSFENRYILAEEDFKIQILDRKNGKVFRKKNYTFSQSDKRNWTVFSKDNKHILISLKTGSVIHLEPDTIELIMSRSKEVSDYLGFCYIKFKKNGSFGVMDSMGKMIIEPIYDSIHYYSGWAGHRGIFTLWRHIHNKVVMDAYFVHTKTWIRGIESAYRPGVGFSLNNFINATNFCANVIKVGDSYHRFDQSTMKLGKPIQVDTILFVSHEGCWIIKQNGSIDMWYLDKDSIIDGITDYKVLSFKQREVIFLKQGKTYNMAFTDFRIHKLSQIDDVSMPYDKSFLFVLKSQDKLALFSPNAFYSESVYDDVRVGLNRLIWVKMDGEWMIAKEGLW